MAVTSYKVPAGYKPTPAVVKANPTVKTYSQGQIINVPVTPPKQTIDARQGFVPQITTSVFGTPQVVPLNLNQTAALATSYNGMTQTAQGSGGLGNGYGNWGSNYNIATEAKYGSGGVITSVTNPLSYGLGSYGGGSANSSGGGGGNGGRGGGGNNQVYIAPNPIVPPVIRRAENDVNVALNWRVG